MEVDKQTDHRQGVLDKLSGLWYSPAHVPPTSTAGRVSGPAAGNATPCFEALVVKPTGACYLLSGFYPGSHVLMGEKQFSGVPLQQSR
jgi:hypothetical protein